MVDFAYIQRPEHIMHRVAAIFDHRREVPVKSPEEHIAHLLIMELFVCLRAIAFAVAATGAQLLAQLIDEQSRDIQSFELSQHVRQSLSYGNIAFGSAHFPVAIGI